jgi:hypothetical protein
MTQYPSALLAVFLVIDGTLAFAQGPPPGGGVNAARVPEGITMGYMSQGDVKGLADFVDSTRLLERKDLVPKTVAAKRSTAMLKALSVPCQLTDAKHIAAGKTMIGGKSVDVGLYEVACANGMGYLLTMRDFSMVSGISCLAASATQAGEGSDQARVDSKCHLPANANLNEMAATVMRNFGTQCAASKVKWLGESAEPKLDYTEVACSDDRGFVLRTPALGAAGNIDIFSCHEAVAHGAKCQLTGDTADTPTSGTATTAGTAAEAPAAPTRPTLQWFKDALSKNGVACEVKRARIVGRETIKRRYIVEYQCPQQPRGVMAYIPSEGDTVNLFEWVDCDTAASRKLSCQFTGDK